MRKQIALRIITIRCVWGSDFFVLQSDKQLLDMVLKKKKKKMPVLIVMDEFDKEKDRKGELSFWNHT